MLANHIRLCDVGALSPPQLIPVKRLVGKEDQDEEKKMAAGLNVNVEEKRKQKQELKERRWEVKLAREM
jgi:hypothetical protein